MILVAVVVVIVLLVMWRYESNLWNGGACRECKNWWVSSYTDSQGWRGYKCAGGHYCWISLPVDRRYIDG